ncbi:MAG: hypothetical protein R3282_00135 [Rhodothermales bacterium]|nr:hypothetical protein [Rhodothermales bacterium]
MMRSSVSLIGAGLACLSMLSACGPRAGHVLDEAMSAERAADSFPGADEDYFRDMDRGVELSPAEIRGRNNWIVWSGGNDRFWDHLANHSFGMVDFLKTVSSHPSLKFSRDNRWRYLGLVNEPCFEKATGPDPTRYGLWLDKRRADCPPDPFENEMKYPGVKVGARGKNVPVGSYYGYASGVVGLRLFPNPDFDEEAEKRWDSVRYYTDPKYYQDKHLVRPFRVGMSCGFCHVGPSPINPPKNPEQPAWENLTSNPGAQYFWFSRVFSWNPDKENFVWQIFETALPGTLDTSLISTDNINNPRTMNAVYSLAARLGAAKRWGKEKLAGGGLKNKQFNDFPETRALSSFFVPPDTIYTPRVLKDGADSVGALGALNRVYVNIGVFSEEWLLHFNMLIGGKEITPFKIEVAERNSSYWNAQTLQTPDLALFFLKTARPDYLADAPGGERYLTRDRAKLERGKVVFAENCARCHSSKIPIAPDGVDEQDWDQYWAWTKTEDFKARMRKMVLDESFLEDNFLSTERRVPVRLLETNACSPLATNAIGGNIWDNFSSRTYKDLPSVGTITVHDPITGEERPYEMPAGGRGYTRPPSLISLWSTAPFLLNNSVGEFNYDPSVEGRMRAFNDGIQKLLWPEKRKKDPILGDKVPGYIHRTTSKSYIKVPAGYLPGKLKWLLGWGNLLPRLFPWAFAKEEVKIGPIPEGTPINLLANLDLEADRGELKELLFDTIDELKSIQGMSDEQAKEHLKRLAPQLVELSKCPDYVVNRGHYFGTDRFEEEPGLSDQDKWALIEFLKTM